VATPDTAAEAAGDAGTATPVTVTTPAAGAAQT
jgi:hypothetical protein